jgi:hypothetical protein
MEHNHLYILWTNADPVTSEHMVMMYATNAMLNHWWEKVTVIIWGATSKLICENEALQLKMTLAKQAGVEFTACLSCAINLGTLEKLEEMGLEVKRWGKPLTELIKADEKILTV